MTSKAGGAVYTLGVGRLEREHLVRWLMCRDVEFVLDTRSPPHALDRQEFFPDEFSSFLHVQGIKYLDLHEQLGDRPRDISLRTAQGRMDYRRYLARTYAIGGINRVALAFTTGCRVCVLGREPKPVYAHHARLVGQGLHERGITARHLTHLGGHLMPHPTLIKRVQMIQDSIHFSPAA